MYDKIMYVVFGISLTTFIIIANVLLVYGILLAHNYLKVIELGKALMGM